MAPNIAYLSENCFKSIPQKNLIQNVALPDNWCHELAKAIGETLGYSVIQQMALTRNLDKHVNNEVDNTRARYINHLGLKQSLMSLYQHVFFSDKPVSVNVKQIVALKLVEDIEFCSAGYHNRVNEALAACCLPSSIDELLEQIRNSIVMGIAVASNDYVHRVPAYFELAKRLGYGVSSLNASDVYMQGGSEVEIRSAFQAQYRPDKLFISLVDSIQGVLRESFGYHGLVESSSAYDLGDCESMLGYLQMVLGSDEPLDAAEYFITATNSAYVDLNWSKIYQKLMDYLVQRNYFSFDNEAASYLLSLFDLNLHGQYSALLDQYVNELEKRFRVQYGYRGAVGGYSDADVLHLLDGVKDQLMLEDHLEDFIIRTEDGTPVDLNWPRIKEECFFILKEQGPLPFESLEALEHPRHDVNWSGIESPAFFEIILGLLLRLEHVDHFEVFTAYINLKKQLANDPNAIETALFRQLISTYRANENLVNWIKDTYLRSYVHEHSENDFLPTWGGPYQLSSDALYFSWCCFSVMPLSRKKEILSAAAENPFRGLLMLQGSTEMFVRICEDMVTFSPEEIKAIIHPQAGKSRLVDKVITWHPQAVLPLVHAMARGLSFQEQIDLYQDVLLNRNHLTQPATTKVIDLMMQLAKLGQKAGKLQHHQAAKQAAKDLHAALKDKFFVYMDSKQEKEDLFRLNTESRELLAAARQGVLATHRGCKDILVQALLCLTGIGLLYVGLKKATEYYRFGLFKPFTNTDSVNTIDAIQSNLNRLCEG